jgi:hypothetical protein
MSNGWIKLHRKIQDNPIWDKPEQLRAWIDLLLMATHKERTKFINGEEVILEQGEVDASFRYLSKRWNWSVGKVQRFLNLLKKCLMIEVKTDTGQNLVSICNYATYQIEENKNDTQVGTPPIRNRYENKNVKKERKNIYVQEFEKLWSLVPKKVNKKKSYQKYILAVKKKDHETIYTSFKNQVLNNWKETDAQYTPALNVWLNGERWNDDIIKASEKPFKQKKQFRVMQSGMYRGYCSKCGDTMFLEHKELNFSSVCCGVEFVPEKPKKYNGKDYTNETLNQIMEGSL